MFVSCLRIGGLGLVASFFAGCGGSGGGMSCPGGAGCATGGNPTAVTFTFNGPNIPTVVAAKIGTGAFAAQTLSGGTLSLTIPAGTSNYAVAALCPGQQNEYIWEASTADGTSPTYQCGYAGQTGTLTGELDASAISGVQSFWTYAGSADSFLSGQALGSATEPLSMDAPAGSDRVLVLAYNQSQGEFEQGPLAAKNFESQTVPGALNGGDTVVFGTADETASEPITYSNVPSGFNAGSFVLVQLVMGGVDAVLYQLGAATSYPVMPASATESGDYYLVYGGAGETGSNSFVSSGTATSGGPVSFALPAPWSYSGPTPAALPSFTLNYTGFSGQANVYQEVEIDCWSGCNSTVANLIQVDATVDYQDGSTTLAIPDLSGVTGFLAPPTSGMGVLWYADVWKTSYGLTNVVPPLNSTWSEVSNSGYYTVP